MQAGWVTICPDQKLLKFLIYSILVSGKDEWTLWAHSSQSVTSTSPPKMPFQRSPITSHCGMTDTASLLSTPLSGISWNWPLLHPWNRFFFGLPGQSPTRMPSFPPASLAAPTWSPSQVSPCLPNHLMLQCSSSFSLFSFLSISTPLVISPVLWLEYHEWFPTLHLQPWPLPATECQVSLNGQKCSRRRDLFS